MMHQRLPIICWLMSAGISALSPGYAFSALGAPPPFSIEEAIRQAWAKSSQIRGQEIQTTLSSGDRWRRFVPNEPQFQYTNADDDTANSYALQLTTSFPGKAFAFTRMDAAKDRTQQAELQAKKYDLAKTVAQAYLDCASARALYELQITTSNDLETVFQTLKALYETGHSTQAEKIGGELQARLARLDLVTAQDKQDSLCKKFKSIMITSGVVEGDTDLVLPDDVGVDLLSDFGPLTSDQGRAVAAIDTAEANFSTAWWSQLPDLTFNLSRNHYVYLPGSPSGKEWTTNYGLSVTLPLLFPFHETVEAKRARSQSMIDQNTAEIQKVQADSDHLDGAKEYQRSRKRLQELRSKDLALGEALVESTFSAYRAGKLGYAELVLSRKTLTDLRSQDIQLRSTIINAHLRCLRQCDPAESKAVPIEASP